MKPTPQIRNYKTEDKAAILKLLRLNTPEYFSHEEEKGLIYYLDHEIENYFVIEIDHEIVGSGGFNFSGNPAIAKISWDILHPDFHGQSLGSKLLNYRIAQIQQFKTVRKIIVRTSQLVYRFYEKMGFSLIEITENYWAEDFHLYYMEYDRPA